MYNKKFETFLVFFQCITGISDKWMPYAFLYKKCLEMCFYVFLCFIYFFQNSLNKKNYSLKQPYAYKMLLQSLKVNIVVDRLKKKIRTVLSYLYNYVQVGE